MKIMTVIGARPQFIKAAAVSRKLREKDEEILVHTGQHYDKNMSEVFFSELEIPQPDYNLSIGSGGHGYQTGNMLIKIEEILLKEKPDCMLIYGDTNSTIAGALAASKLLIPVAHIEAGLRSFNMSMPEEQNRILTDHISKYLFAPTQTAVDNLEKESVVGEVFNVGDVMYDAVLHFGEMAEKKTDIVERLGLKKNGYILATIHRAENTNDINRMTSITQALTESGKNIVLPLHPRTRKYMADYGLTFGDNIKIIEPVGYLEMLMLEKNSEKIVTDSGGVQKEAFFLGKPCITLRDETEWVETVENGWNTIVGCNKEKILSAIKNFMPNTERINHFGDGNAAQQIVDILNEGLSN